MQRAIIAVVIALGAWVGAARSANANTLDYYGEDLFIGMAYHRWACVTGPNSPYPIQSNNTYQGFTGTQHCVQGVAYDAISYDTYLGWTDSDSRGHTEANGWLGYYYGYANWDYGLALSGTNAGDWHNYSHSWQTNYSNNDTFGIDSRSSSGAPNGCGYNVLTDCNSDCWIKDFSSREGWTVGIASPCL